MAINHIGHGAHVVVQHRHNFVRRKAIGERREATNIGEQHGNWRRRSADIKRARKQLIRHGAIRDRVKHAAIFVAQCKALTHSVKALAQYTKFIAPSHGHSPRIVAAGNLA